METFTLPETSCPVCGKLLNSATGERQPKSGDVTICLGCESLLEVQDDMTYKKASKEAIEEILSDEETAMNLLIYQKAIREMKTQNT